MGENGVSEVPPVKERHEALDTVKEEINEVEDDVDVEIGLWVNVDRVAHRRGRLGWRKHGKIGRVHPSPWEELTGLVRSGMERVEGIVGSGKCRTSLIERAEKEVVRG